MRLSINLAAILLFSSTAYAQSPLWSGQYVPGHAVQQAVAGVLSDAGSSIGSSTKGVGYLTELGITNTGTPFCINDALINAVGGYHQFCLASSATVGGNTGAFLTYNAYGGAANQPIYFSLNGVNYQFPGAGNGDVLGPASVGSGDFAVYNGTNPLLLADGGAVGTAAHVNTGTSGATLGLLNGNLTLLARIILLEPCR